MNIKNKKLKRRITMNTISNKKIFLISTILIILITLGILTFRASGDETAPTKQVANKTQDMPKLPLSHYIEVIKGCGPYYNIDPCVNMRSGPGTEYKVVERLRTGVVLKVESTVEKNGQGWYKIIFDDSILYPERVKGDWYVAVDPESVQPIENIGDEELTKNSATTSKYIIIDLSQEMLYAYDGDKLFMQEPISTGLDFTPTPVGKFTVFKKTPSRYMQGPIPNVSTQVYDLPGVPWNLYFTSGGSVIHGAYWHDHFGKPWSHGCVNLPPQKAKELYMWANIGISVTVKK